MKQFSLEKWLQDKSRKVVTRDGRDVRIICWDAKNSKPIVALVLTRSISRREFDERTINYFNDGTYYGGAKEDFLDLFFVDEEVELTEFEKHVQALMMNCGLVGCTKSYKDIDAVKATSKHLLDLAKKEVLKEQKHCVTIPEDDYYKELASQYKQGREDTLKDMPNWKKGNDGEFLYETSIVWIHNETKTLATAGLRLDSNTFYIPISELEKLPKEE